MSDFIMRGVGVSLPDDLIEYVSELAAARHYGNFSAALREIIKRDRARARVEQPTRDD